jgi:hypothetical protein
MMSLNVGTREVGSSTHDGVFGSVFPSSRKEKLILPAKHSTVIAGSFLFHTLPGEA